MGVWVGALITTCGVFLKLFIVLHEVFCVNLMFRFWCISSLGSGSGRMSTEDMLESENDRMTLGLAAKVSSLKSVSKKITKINLKGIVKKNSLYKI